MTAPLLQVEDLRTHFFNEDGVTRAVDGLSLDLRRNEILCVVGESGSGKSLTAHAVMGLLPAPQVRASAGAIRFAGVDRRKAPFVDVWLRSGDLLVFGGATRRIYHGVPKVLTGTAPAGLGLPPGRLSITIRETGLS